MDCGLTNISIKAIMILKKDKSWRVKCQNKCDIEYYCSVF